MHLGSKLIVVGGLAGGLALPAPAEATARPKPVVVKTERQFQQAVQRLKRPGGTIVLRGGRYRALSVGPRSARPLVVRAQRGVSVRRILLRRTRSVRLEHVVFSPDARSASLEVRRSRGVELHDIRVRGTTARHARVLLDASNGVTITASRFSRCGDGSVCLLLGRSSNVLVEGSRFQDCFGCDFVRGRAGTGLVLRGNRFLRALVGPCGTDPAACNHNDLVQVQAGRNVLVERNVFGLVQPPGAGQLYFSGPIDGLVVRDNLFRATDPALPGFPVPPNGIVLGNRRGPDALPANVTIAHNTILSGARRGFGQFPDLANSLVVSPRYGWNPEEARPLVVNNVFALTETVAELCGLARTARNVTIRGAPCSEEDVVGDPGLTEAGVPGPHSILVADRGLPGFSSVDFLRRPRDEAPDIGAYEIASAP